MNTRAILIAAVLALSPAVHAAADLPTPATMTQGEVRKVDKDAKKITIRHEDIRNLGMPAMTMVFPVKDAAMLDQVKAGDKIQFMAEKVGGAVTVTKLDPARS